MGSLVAFTTVIPGYRSEISTRCVAMKEMKILTHDFAFRTDNASMMSIQDSRKCEFHDAGIVNHKHELLTHPIVEQPIAKPR